MGNAPRPRPKRHPNRAEARAIAWADQHERAALKVGNGKSKDRRRAPSLLAFSVKRMVLGNTPDNLYERNDIFNLAAKHTGVSLMNVFGVSLIPPSEGRRSTNPWDNDKTRIERLEEVADTQPHIIEGIVSRVGIVGAPKNLPGRRFVSLFLDLEAQQKLKHERDKLLTVAEIDDPLTLTPHISLFETTDQRVAADLRDQVKMLSQQSPIPVLLGRAIVDEQVNQPKLNSLREL